MKQFFQTVAGVLGGILIFFDKDNIFTEDAVNVLGLLSGIFCAISNLPFIK